MWTLALPAPVRRLPVTRTLRARVYISGVTRPVRRVAVAPYGRAWVLCDVSCVHRTPTDSIPQTHTHTT